MFYSNSLIIIQNPCLSQEKKGIFCRKLFFEGNERVKYGGFGVVSRKDIIYLHNFIDITNKKQRKGRKMTHKLYYKDPYQTQFSATVSNAIPLNETFGIVLSETCFYPEGGGQPGDVGYLNRVKVLDTQVINRAIAHITEKSLPIGQKVTGKIDWERRFDWMQHHTGQHILSASVKNVIGANTVSVHFGEEVSTLDVDKSDFDWESLHKVEEYANQIIYENRPVKIHWAKSEAELEKFPLRKPPPLKENIRIVEVEDLDVSACGGTHVVSTGEVGMIKLRKWGKVRGNVRLEFFCGVRALRDYQWKNRMILEISDMMTIKDAQVKEKVYKLYEENKSNIKIINDLISQLLSYEAEKLLEDAMKVDNVTIVKKIFRNREFSEVKKLVSLLTEWDNVIILVSSINAKASLIFACSDNLNYDMKTLLERTCSLIDGGGGGRRKLAQGGGSAENIEQAIEFAAQEVSKRLS